MAGLTCRFFICKLASGVRALGVLVRVSTSHACASPLPQYNKVFVVGRPSTPDVSAMSREIRAVIRRQLTAGISSMMDVLDPMLRQTPTTFFHTHFHVS